MNANRLITMVVRMFMRKLVNRGVNAAIGKAGRRGEPRRDMTPQERKTAGSAKRTARHARQAGRLFRRMGRF